MVTAVPTVHINGTAKQDLFDPIIQARQDILIAIESLKKCAPNGRDYYVQDNSAFTVAVNEYGERVRALEFVAEELMTLAEKISEQGDTR